MTEPDRLAEIKGRLERIAARKHGEPHLVRHAYVVDIKYLLAALEDLEKENETGRRRVMAENLELFTDKEIGKRVVYGNTCTPANVGTGPSGETCGGCMFLRRKKSHSHAFLKCGKMESSWTNGDGTDIRACWTACREWNEIPHVAAAGT